MPKSKSEKNKGGRPSKFPVGYESAIKMLAEKGCTDAEMAKAFKVTEQTFNNWKLQRPKFFESLKEWKITADSKVEKALYDRAIGCTVKEEKALFIDSKIEIIETDKNYPPDTAACVVWLANRQPDKWKKDPGQSSSSVQVIADALSEIADKLPL